MFERFVERWAEEALSDTRENPVEISGPLPGASLAGRLDATIEKITNNSRAIKYIMGRPCLWSILDGSIRYLTGPQACFPYSFTTARLPRAARVGGYGKSGLGIWVS